MVSSEDGNHGVQKNKKTQTLDCVRKTLKECIVVIASRDVSKSDRFCNMSSGKESQEQVSHEAQVQISTLIKKIEINEETDNFV